MKNTRFKMHTILVLLAVLLAACSGNASVNDATVDNTPVVNTPEETPQASNTPESLPLEIDIAPDFTLPDKDGNMVSLEGELQNNKYVVVVFYFGYSCPPCMDQLREIENDAAKYKEVDAQVIAIAFQSETGAESSARATQAQFPILAGDRDTAEAYGVYDNGASIPSVFIINQEREVVWGHIANIPQGCGKFRVSSQTILEKISAL